MTHRQFGLLAGFLLAWAWIESGFLAVVAACVAAAIGLGVARIVDGEVDLAEVTDRLTHARR